MLAMKIDMSDLDRKFALLLEMPRTIEKAIVGAMTDTVKEVHAAQIQEMKLSLHMPTGNEAVASHAYALDSKRPEDVFAIR